MPAIHKEIDKFYHSKRWKSFRNYIIYSRHGICEECGKPGTEVHHIKALTLENYLNDEVALNPKNMKLLCRACHDSERSKEKEIRKDVMFDENGDLIAKF